MTSESAGNEAMTLSTWCVGKMLQSAMRARARASTSRVSAGRADPEGPLKARSAQPGSAQAEGPWNRSSPPGKVRGLRWGSRSPCGSPGRYPPRRRT